MKDRMKRGQVRVKQRRLKGVNEERVEVAGWDHQLDAHEPG